MSRRPASFYRSMADFERDEIMPHKKCGWSLDDLYSDATFHGSDEESSDEPKELDFDFGP